MKMIKMIIQGFKSGWTTLKIVRVALGVLVLYTSIAERNTAGIILGALFTIISLFLKGNCCMAGACGTGVQPKKNTIPENIDYEELGHQ